MAPRRPRIGRMNWTVAVAFAACATAFASSAASAADLPPPLPAPAAVATPPAPPLDAVDQDKKGVAEPVIKRSVIEDRGARIEELRVRGQLQKVTVAPKGDAPGYEILLGDSSRVFADDPGTSRGSAGKRVWNVLRF